MAKQLPYPVMREIFSRFENSEPEPKGELNHVNAYTLVVAVALSAQATDKGVNKATEALFKSVDTPQKMLDLGEDGLIAQIKTIGLYKTKARNVMKMAQILVEEFGGEVPNSRAGCLAKPTGCWTQNCKCRVEYVVAAAGTGGRHAYFPGGKPRRHCAGQNG